MILSVIQDNAKTIEVFFIWIAALGAWATVLPNVAAGLAAVWTLVLLYDRFFGKDKPK